MKKFVSFVLIILMVIMVAMNPICHSATENMQGNHSEIAIKIVYTDEELSSYMDNAAISFYAKTGIHVKPELVSGLDYLENINEETLHSDTGPDLFVVGNESLEKAVLSGLAAPLNDEAHILNTAHFPQVALDAVSYQGDYVGYPFYYETSVFLYNKTYLEQIAQKAKEEQQKASEEQQQFSEESGEQEAVTSDTQTEESKAVEDITPESILPKSMVGILEFSNEYDPPEGMEVFLKWDVTDILYNYAFAGAYMEMGGPGGDNRDQVDLYNANAMYALGVYQDFNQFFSIEAEDISYDSVINEFIEGKVMFTFANTGVISRLEQAKADGKFMYEYGIASMEMLNTNLQTKTLSVTNTVVVNGYGEKRDIAEEFAAYLCKEYVSNLYARSGKLCAYSLSEYEYDSMRDAKQCYQGSVPIPKIVESGNYWVLAELCYTNIWQGDDVNDTLLALANKINAQIYGEEAVVIEPIDTPEIVESYIQSE